MEIHAGHDEIMAIRKLREGTSATREREHLSSLLTIVDTLCWQIKKENGLREQVQALKKTNKTLEQQVNKSCQKAVWETQRLKGITTLLIVSVLLAISVVTVVGFVAPDFTSILAAMFMVVFLVLVTLAAMEYLPAPLVKFFANKFGGGIVDWFRSGRSR